MHATLATQIITTLIFLLLIIPGGPLTVATLMSVANMGAGGKEITGFDYFIGFGFLISTGIYPLVAIISVVGSWIAYSGDHLETAFYLSLLPLLNIVIFAIFAVAFFGRLIPRISASQICLHA